jgi:hypothetical protein
MIADTRSERVAIGTLFSRRRLRRRPQSRGQYRLPDWVWGVAIGVVVALVGLGFFLFVGTGGSGGSTCDSELTSLPGKAAVTAEGFQEEDTTLGETIAFLNKADLAGASETFYGEVHAFTHNVDADLRAVDEEAAKRLCEAVLDLEEALEGGSPGAMSASAANLREELRDAAETLGFARPSG